MKILRRCLLLAWVLFEVGSPRAATAQGSPPSDDPNQPPVVRLTLSPAPAPVPALKYELLPNVAERQPGNAATNYYRSALATKMIAAVVLKEESNWFAEFGDDAYHKVPRERLQAWIDAYRGATDEFRHASFRERCDWELRMQDLRGLDTLNYTIDEFQQLRWLMRPITLRTRLAIEDGKLDEAFDWLRVGYQSARHVASQPNAICVLIGVAFVYQNNERVEQWISTPGSPNLYWALAALPRPLVSFRESIDQERALPERLFPFLKDAETSVRSPEEWQRLFLEAVQQFSQLSESSGPTKFPAWQNQVAAVAAAARGYPRAKSELVAAGFDRDRLEKMPVGQVLAIQTARATRETYDNMLKSYYLPYPQALIWSEKMNRQFVESRLPGGAWTGPEVFPISQLLLPAMTSVIRAEIRAERHLAALQTLEAIRMHMAASGGRLPVSLQEITIVPVPLNPATNQLFPYHLEADRAVLEVPAATGEATQQGRRYLLQARMN